MYLLTEQRLQGCTDVHQEANGRMKNRQHVTGPAMLTSLLIACCNAMCPQVEMLQYLSTVAKGTAQRFAMLNALVSALFDLNPSTLTHLKVQHNESRLNRRGKTQTVSPVC
jgi:hypothetical protein